MQTYAVRCECCALVHVVQRDGAGAASRASARCAMAERGLVAQPTAVLAQVASRIEVREGHVGVQRREGILAQRECEIRRVRCDLRTSISTTSYSWRGRVRKGQGSSDARG